MDDTLSISTDFIDDQIQKYDFNEPLIINISGPQGSGKSYLTNQLYNYLKSKYHQHHHPYQLNTIQFSMDDFYLCKSDQDKLNNTTKNPLLKGRGLPGTHELTLLSDTFNKLINNYKKCKQSNGGWEVIKIPSYNKGAFNGIGDRSIDNYTLIETPIDIIIFEGWFNGFYSLDPTILQLKYLTSSPSPITPKGISLQSFKLYDLQEINNNLKNYESMIWPFFKISIIFHTNEIINVYPWRLQQEHELIKSAKEKGLTIGMNNDDEIIKFINRYMPIYLLYYEDLCDYGIKNCQNLIISIDSNRKVINKKILKEPSLKP
ncbi:kinase of unknown function, putative [Candida dubliniensis CD36]|uniref:ATP-dependent kinase n=1 Tax=Candida dubliniensis (strain CD36 / ATCC MYA-646 / CBS 7987 / NCPF 3949 / NRRL Y-17841) TaxID=573826 RepID=B9WMV9_CANDC|nr:kinase of unknown function, putative [Candida dubliniensis CD36]CAX40425.1 kinase of unknown function, putative [Candida dubliniensis CD36]